MSKLRATQLQYKDLLRGTNKIMSTGYFVEKDNSNYVKDNYDVELLQWSNKIIKDSFTVTQRSQEPHTATYTYRQHKVVRPWLGSNVQSSSQHTSESAHYPAMPLC